MGSSLRYGVSPLPDMFLLSTVNLEIAFEQAHPSDASALADLRVLAMQPSLEAIGRFDLDRARNRFLSTYVSSDTWHIIWNGDKVGLVVLRVSPEEYLLDHFYLRPEFQGKKIGSLVLDVIFGAAEREGIPVRVTALRGSRSNQFYVAHGFRLQAQEEWDNHYIWRVRNP